MGSAENEQEPEVCAVRKPRGSDKRLCYNNMIGRDAVLYDTVRYQARSFPLAEFSGLSDGDIDRAITYDA